MKVIMTPYNEGGTDNYIRLREYYTNQILKRGHFPIILPITNDEAALTEYTKDMEALVITGGADVDPKNYGEEAHEKCGQFDDRQDQMAFKLIDIALQKSVPILGICRGMQVLNVYFGGTLYQDLKSQQPTNISHRPDDDNYGYMHKVTINADTQLAKAIGKTEFQVNSVHHQAVKTVGEKVKIIAHSDDGIIEAIDCGEKIIAVQWHPEALADQDQNHAKIFDYFVQLIENNA